MNTAKYMSEEKWSTPELFRMIASSVFMAATAVDTESSPAYSWKQHSTPAAQMCIGEAGTAEYVCTQSGWGREKRMERARSSWVTGSMNKMPYTSLKPVHRGRKLQSV